MEITNKTLYEILSEFVRENPKKRLFFNEKRCYSAENCLNEINRLAAAFSSNSIEAGDFVALRATRSIDTALLYFALEALGAVVILTDPHNSVSAIPKELGLPVKAFITNEKAEGGIAAEGDWILFTADSVDREIAIEIENGKDKHEFAEPTGTLKKPAVIIFTSGSTGGQKAVTLSQYNIVNHAINYGFGGCYRESDVSSEMLPIHHVFGLAVLLTALVHRYEVYFPEEVTPAALANAIIKYDMTRLDGVPSLLLAVAKHFAESGEKPGALRIGVIGGAVISAEQFSFIENTLKLKLVPVYGMSECIGISGLPETAEDEDRRLTVGVFLPLNRGCIMSDSGEMLPEGKQGEVCVKSPVVMLGYYKNGRLEADNIDANGWLHSGDLGVIDEKGYLHITGRKKDIIIRNGNNLSTKDIADKLMTIDGVSDIVVVGIKDEKVGEVPAAMVVSTKPELFEQMCDKVLTHQEQLAKYLFVTAIPLTSSGKPDKVNIARQLCEKNQ